MDALVFIWDEQKNRLNIAKHQVSFEEAKTVFQIYMRVSLMTLIIQSMKIDFSFWESVKN